MPWLPSANVPRRQRRSNHGLRCQEGPLATVPIPSSPRQRWRHAKIEGNKCTSLGRRAILGRVPGVCRRLCTRRCNSCQERFQKHSSQRHSLLSRCPEPSERMVPQKTHTMLGFRQKGDVHPSLLLGFNNANCQWQTSCVSLFLLAHGRA